MLLGAWSRLKTLMGLLLLSSIALAEEPLSKLNLRPGVTEISHKVFDLHMIILWICVAIGVVVFSVMFWSILMHRKSLGVKPADFHESTKIELLWTIIPVFILVAMAIPATKTLVAMYDTKESDLDIFITGYQWKWKYEYMGQDVSYFSVLATPQNEIHNQEAKGEFYLLEVDQPLVVPVGKKIRFLLTGKDVIHSWWVPDLAVKKDAIPGFVNEAWTRIDKPGVYRGQCAELCGKDHGFMPIVVVAKSQEDYDKWLSERKEVARKEAELKSKQWTLAELTARGEEVYGKNCAACHQVNGAGAPPAFPPLKGSKIATGDRAEHIKVVFNGRPGTYMAAYGPQLSEVDLAAVITYERNAWGNNTGDQVNPIDIVNFKNSK